MTECSDVDVRQLFTPACNFGAGGEARRLVQLGLRLTLGSSCAARQGYAYAHNLAEEQRATRVVNVGPSSADFAARFSQFAGLLVQIEEEVCQSVSGAPSRSFPAVLEDSVELDRLGIELSDARPTVFVLADVIGFLFEPRGLLRILRRLLRLNSANRLVLSVSGRERPDGTPAPGEPAYVRRWTLEELRDALCAAGFTIHHIASVVEPSGDASSLVVELGCTQASYRAFLSAHHLPPPADHLVLTTEHADTTSWGHIGVHCQNLQALPQPPLVLFTGSQGLPENWHDFIRDKGWLHTAGFFKPRMSSSLSSEALHQEEILQAVRQVVFLYDELRLIEYQDYQGVGASVAQAKRARLLPPSLSVMAFAHGSHFYHDHQAGSMSATRDLALDVRERISLELADVVAFPSTFLQDLYLDKQGLQLREHHHLPYFAQVVSDGGEDLHLPPISTLVFCGESGSPKSYLDFCEAVLALFERENRETEAFPLTRLVLMGDVAPDPRLVALEGVEIRHGRYPRREWAELLREFAPEALVILPCREGEQLFSTVEGLDARCHVLAIMEGNASEQLLEGVCDQVLWAPRADVLTREIARAIRMKPPDRLRLIRKFRAGLEQASVKSCERYIALLQTLKQREPAEQPPRGAVSVIVPNLNGQAHCFRDLITGLRHSYSLPQEVLLIDDGSYPTGVALLQDVRDALAPIPAQLIQNPVNLGLAGARNVGLSQVVTPYVCAHDHDNIVSNRFLDLACRILDENPEIAAVTTWMIGFQDGAQWEYERPESRKFEYRPIGADLGLGLRDNCFGDALAVYRVESLRELGGWDDSSKAIWEDWQLFVRLTAAGKRILVIPEDLIFYRIRPDSLLRVSPTFDAWLRIGRALPGIPTNQVYGLVRSVNHASVCVMPADTRELSELKKQLRAIEHSTTWRATRRLRNLLSAHPRLREGVKRLARVFGL